MVYFLIDVEKLGFLKGHLQVEQLLLEEALSERIHANISLRKILELKDPQDNPFGIFAEELLEPCVSFISAAVDDFHLDDHKPGLFGIIHVDDAHEVLGGDVVGVGLEAHHKVVTVKVGYLL